MTQAFLIDTHELASRLGEPDLIVLDVTAGPVPVEGGKEVPSQEAFSLRHIPGSSWLDQGKRLSLAGAPFGFTTPPNEQITAVLQELGVGPQTQVVLVSGGTYGWAARVWLLLWSIGFDRAYVLDGGLQKWLADGLPVESGAGKPEGPAAAEPLPITPREVFVNRDRVLAAVETGDAHIVDSLSPAQFDGTAASKHGRRGHIKNAVNVPSGKLLDVSNNTFKDAEANDAVFADAGVGRDKALITYCGAGIAASVDAFAALRAGYDKVFVYDASLAEWARDPSLPMVPGTPS